jgi:hypothetical protein
VGMGRRVSRPMVAAVRAARALAGRMRRVRVGVGRVGMGVTPRF